MAQEESPRRRCHYIAQSYIGNFSYNQEKVNKNKNIPYKTYAFFKDKLTIKSVEAKEICEENKLYKLNYIDKDSGNNYELEKYFSWIESIFLKITNFDINNIIPRKIYCLATKDLFNIFCVLYKRNPFVNDGYSPVDYEKIIDNNTIHRVDDSYLEYDSDSQELNKLMIELEATNEEFDRIFDSVLHFIDFQDDLLETFIVRTDYKFISSDNPYIFLTSKEKGNILIFFPLSTNIMSIFLVKRTTRLINIECNYKNIIKINSSNIFSCEEKAFLYLNFLFSCDDKFSDYLNNSLYKIAHNTVFAKDKETLLRFVKLNQNIQSTSPQSS